jgi:DNA-directed RNA polymerase specialized sigma24 family protein
MSAEPHQKRFVTELTAGETVGANFAEPPSSDGMATHTRQPPGPTRTRALLEEIAGGQRAAQLRAQVAAANRGATPEQIEEAFQEACLRATRGCHGQTMGEVYVWLRKTTGTLLSDMRDRLKREILVDHTAPDFHAVDPSTATPDEILIKRDERSELDALTLAILDRLCERERTIAVLHSHGYARKEIAERLGLTTRVVKRAVEEVLTTGRSQLAKFTGYGCPDGHQLVSRYAFGLAAGREARRAQLHLATCPRCGAMYERLDVWRERVAALLPVPPVAADHREVIERVVHAGADTITSTHTTECARTGIRRQLAEAAGQLREHTAAAYTRAVDPTPIAGVRPGAVAAAVAGCIAVGGGATYCVEQSVGPLAGFAGKPIVAHDAHERPKHKPTRAHGAQLALPAATPTVATPPPARTQTVSAPPPATTTQAAPPPAPQDEFEPTSAGATQASAPTATTASTSSSRTTTATHEKPAAAPASGPGEFDGP